MRAGAPGSSLLLLVLCSSVWSCSPSSRGEGGDTVTDRSESYPIVGSTARDESARGCAVGALDLTAEIIAVLPRWTADPGAPAELVTRWAAYVGCARLHEAGHRRIYLDALPQFRRRARTLAPRPTCDALTAALDALAHAWLEEIKELQVAYETRTDHGYIQCGRFP